MLPGLFFNLQNEFIWKNKLRMPVRGKSIPGWEDRWSLSYGWQFGKDIQEIISR